MKKIVLGIATLLLVMTSCKKQEIKSVQSNVVEGKWRITKFIDSGVDETTDYSGVEFLFDENGTVTASGTVSTSGTWSVAKESKSDDDLFDDNHVEFNLYFSTHLIDLSDDWHIESQSDSKISLKDIDKDNESESDYLTIEKI